jgi:hypothetical protein
MCHYQYLIQQFGAPNGICTSITEHAHIASIKDPWRRTNKNDPLKQILLVHNRLNLLSAYCTQLEAHGLLKNTALWECMHKEDGESSESPTSGHSDDGEDATVDENTQQWRTAQRRLTLEEDDDEPSGHLGHTLDADVVLAKTHGKY